MTEITQRWAQHDPEDDDTRVVHLRLGLRTRPSPRLRALLGRDLGFSIHGVIATARVRTHPTARRTAYAGLILGFGAALIGLGIALLVRAELGLPPYDVLLSVIRDRIGVTQGQAGWILTGALLVIASALGRRPTLATVAYVLAVGAAIDLTIAQLNAPDSLILRVAFSVLGITLLAAGIALVIHAGLGGGGFELLMLAGADRGIDPSKVRLAMEVGVLTIGTVLGGDFGPMTIVFAAGIAPLLRLGAQALEDHRAGREARLARR